MSQPLACPSCALPYRADDVHPSERVAVCRACDQVNPLGRPDRPPVAQPPRWRRAEEGGGLVLRKRWIGLELVVLVPWCVIWNYGVLSIATQNPATWPLLMFHIAAGLAVTWFTLGVIVNTSTITVRGGRLTLAHAPLPWPGAVTIATQDIEQLHVARTSSGRSRTFHVFARCRDGLTRKVTPSLGTRDEARWVEQEIEAHLGIEDRPVAGEA